MWGRRVALEPRETFCRGRMSGMTCGARNGMGYVQGLRSDKDGRIGNGLRFFLSLCVCVCGGGQYFCIFLNSNSHLLFPTFFLPRYLYPFSSSRFAICAFLNVSFLRHLAFPPPFLRRTMPSFFVCFLLCFLLCSLLGTCRSAKGSKNIKGGLVSSPSPLL